MAETATHYRWDDLPREELNPLIGRRFITGDQMMIAHVYLAKGAIVPKHSHENEQITYILEGRAPLLARRRRERGHRRRRGRSPDIPPHLPHKAEALEDTLDVDVFTPPRQDWLDGSERLRYATRRAGRPVAPGPCSCSQSRCARQSGRRASTSFQNRREWFGSRRWQSSCTTT